MSTFSHVVHYADFQKLGPSNMSSKTIEGRTYGEFKQNLQGFCDTKGFLSLSPMLANDSGELEPAENVVFIQQLTEEDVNGFENLWVSRFEK